MWVTDETRTARDYTKGSLGYNTVLKFMYYIISDNKVTKSSCKRPQKSLMILKSLTIIFGNINYPIVTKQKHIYTHTYIHIYTQTGCVFMHNSDSELEITKPCLYFVASARGYL